jgi:chromate reductase, NAD(P)H dehydrogenase (quinone)
MSNFSSALEALGRIVPEGVKVLVYGDLAKLPPFNPDDDLEDKPKPAPVETLRALVDASNALVLAAPEYAHGLPGALKNALDWPVASETFAGKPTALINTSPRAFHAQASLREILSTMAARLIPEAFSSISLTGKATTANDIRYSGRHRLRAAACGIARGAYRRDKRPLSAPKVFTRIGRLIWARSTARSQL